MPSLHPIFSDKKIAFLDMDGTIYLGDLLIQGAREFLDALEEESIIHYFLTNNSSRSKEDTSGSWRSWG
jgi:ribonucleotide monophosphatase NagD (HAD superfamily)